jgi:hypothetical protein
MQICVHLDSARLFRWHLALLAALCEAGHEAVVSFVDTPEPLPTSFTVILDYDRARAHLGDERFSTRLAPSAFVHLPRYAGGGYDVMLDLSSASCVRTHPGRVLRPLYDGSYKDYVLFSAAASGQPPMLAIADSLTRHHIWPIGKPAIETPWRPSQSLDQITSRLIEGFVGTLAAIGRGEDATMERPEQTNFAGRSSILEASGSWAWRRVKRKATRVLDKLSRNEPKWHVAWRMVRDSEPIKAAHYAVGQFRTLDDAAASYFADPFLFVHQGSTHIFVEEVPNATGRGIISHFTLDARGVPSKPSAVLDTGSHLSYPQVFEHGGEIYMMPESSAAGGLDLYRATTFPLAWEKVGRLTEGRIHDATLFGHEGRLWIAAGSETLQSSSWDGLSLYYADRLEGPWSPHHLNPVLIDAAGARPAGPLWRDAQGSLVRPAQDCTRGYGGALTLKRILELSPARFREEPMGTVAFGEAGILGPHTIGRAGGFEVVDLFARPGALRAGYRA